MEVSKDVQDCYICTKPNEKLTASQSNCRGPFQYWIRWKHMPHKGQHEARLVVESIEEGGPNRFAPCT